MRDYFKHIPFGCSLPFENPHAVSVSFPFLQNVIDYEERDENTLAQMQSGYPRFFQNKLVEKLVVYIRNKYAIAPEKIILPIASMRAKTILEELVGITFEYVEEDENVFLILENNPTVVKECADYIRNIGLLISSRKAESTLLKLNQIKSIFEEEKSVNFPEKQIKNILAKAYSVDAFDNILLANSGMNALFAAYKTIVKAHKNNTKKAVVQLGWLYVDIMEIIQKQEQGCYIQINIYDKEQLENWLENNHSGIATLITEVVTNPLIQCVDLPWLSALCKKYNIVLIIDTTLTTPFNATLLPYCDIVVESLTKFACGHGDLLLGAIILNDKSNIAQTLKKQFEDYIVPPFEGETQHLAFQIQNYETRINKISENTFKLLEYLKQQPFIKEIFSVLHSNSLENYSKIRKSNETLPGILSIVFDKDLATYYDRLHLPKGPSLGTEFTIAMPYVYLAHYDYIKNESGKQKLLSLGINPDILRISVGTEPIEKIILAFENLKQLAAPILN